MNITSSEKHRIKTLYGEPEFVKSASDEQDSNNAFMLHSLYADPKNKKFPCHTKEACWFSNAQFWESGIFDKQASTKVGQSLLDFAKYWGIEQEVSSNILEKVASDTILSSIEDLPDSSFAVVQTIKTASDDSESHKVRLMPINTADTVKLAAYQLFESRKKLPYEWRKQAAQNIYSKLEEFNIDIDNDEIADYVEKAAGYGLSSKQTLKDLITDRSNLLKSSKHSEEGESLRSTIDLIDGVPLSSRLCQKVASVIAAIDERYNLTRFYGDGIDAPELTTNAVLKKEAEAELDRYVKINGATYRKDDLATVSDHFEDFPQLNAARNGKSYDFDKVAHVMNNEPKLVGTFEAYLDSAGVDPVDLSVNIDMFR